MMMIIIITKGVYISRLKLILAYLSLYAKRLLVSLSLSIRVHCCHKKYLCSIYGHRGGRHAEEVEHEIRNECVEHLIVFQVSYQCPEIAKIYILTNLRRLIITDFPQVAAHRDQNSC